MTEISPSDRLYDLVAELLEAGMRPDAVRDTAEEAIRDSRFAKSMAVTNKPTYHWICPNCANPNQATRTHHVLCVMCGKTYDDLPAPPTDKQTS